MDYNVSHVAQMAMYNSLIKKRHDQLDANERKAYNELKKTMIKTLTTTTFTKKEITVTAKALGLNPEVKPNILKKDIALAKLANFTDKNLANYFKLYKMGKIRVKGGGNDVTLDLRNGGSGLSSMAEMNLQRYDGVNRHLTQLQKKQDSRMTAIDSMVPNIKGYDERLHMKMRQEMVTKKKQRFKPWKKYQNEIIENFLLKYVGDDLPYLVNIAEKMGINDYAIDNSRSADLMQIISYYAVEFGKAVVKDTPIMDWMMAPGFMITAEELLAHCSLYSENLAKNNRVQKEMKQLIKKGALVGGQGQSMLDNLRRKAAEMEYSQQTNEDFHNVDKSKKNKSMLAKFINLFTKKQEKAEKESAHNLANDANAVIDFTTTSNDDELKKVAKKYKVPFEAANFLKKSLERIDDLDWAALKQEATALNLTTVNVNTDIDDLRMMIKISIYRKTKIHMDKFDKHPIKDQIEELIKLENDMNAGSKKAAKKYKKLAEKIKDTNFEGLSGKRLFSEDGSIDKDKYKSYLNDIEKNKNNSTNAMLKSMSEFNAYIEGEGGASPVIKFKGFNPVDRYDIDASIQGAVPVFIVNDSLFKGNVSKEKNTISDKSSELVMEKLGDLNIDGMNNNELYEAIEKYGMKDAYKKLKKENNGYVSKAKRIDLLKGADPSSTAASLANSTIAGGSVDLTNTASIFENMMDVVRSNSEVHSGFTGDNPDIDWDVALEKPIIHDAFKDSNKVILPTMLVNKVLDARVISSSSDYLLAQYGQKIINTLNTGFEALEKAAYSPMSLSGAAGMGPLAGMAKPIGMPTLAMKNKLSKRTKLGNAMKSLGGAALGVGAVAGGLGVASQIGKLNSTMSGFSTSNTTAVSGLKSTDQLGSASGTLGGYLNDIKNGISELGLSMETFNTNNIQGGETPLDTQDVKGNEPGGDYSGFNNGVTG